MTATAESAAKGLPTQERGEDPEILGLIDIMGRISGLTNAQLGSAMSVVREAVLVRRVRDEATDLQSKAAQSAGTAERLAEDVHQRAGAGEIDASVLDVLPAELQAIIAPGMPGMQTPKQAEVA